MRRRRRKGQAEVIGAMFFIVIASVVFALFMSLAAAEYTLAREAAQAEVIVGYKADESLAVSLSGGGLVQIRNNGPTTALVTYYVAVNGGQQTMFSLSQPIAISPRGTAPISVSPSFQSLGVVTSYGNVWWSS